MGGPARARHHQRRCTSAANGIPLFTEALVNANGTVSLGVPWSLRDQLLGAVKELPEQTQQVLRSAAAGGIRVGHGLLAADTGLDDTGTGRCPLRPAVAANALAADADSYAFRHELIREAVWEDLLPGERTQAERAFAEALEADPALSRTAWSRSGWRCIGAARMR